MYTATLSCGSVLTYESRSFLPPGGELVPCVRHGYCDVVAHGPSDVRRSTLSRPRRAQPKDQAQLLAWLRDRSGTTIHVLRRHRFTLRLVAAAERDGLVAVDLESGVVSIPLNHSSADRGNRVSKDHS